MYTISIKCKEDKAVKYDYLMACDTKKEAVDEALYLVREDIDELITSWFAYIPPVVRFNNDKTISVIMRTVDDEGEYDVQEYLIERAFDRPINCSVRGTFLCNIEDKKSVAENLDTLKDVGFDNVVVFNDGTIPHKERCRFTAVFDGEICTGKNVDIESFMEDLCEEEFDAIIFDNITVHEN